MAWFAKKAKTNVQADESGKPKKKKSLLRRLLKLILWLLLVMILLIVLLLVFLNPIAKFAVNRVAPKVLGIGMSVDSINISLFSGRVGLSGFKIDNPPDRGYQTDHAIYLGTVVVDVDLRTVTSKKIVVEELELRDIDVSYEGDIISSNLQDLIAMLSKEVEEEEAESEGIGGIELPKIDDLSVSAPDVDNLSISTPDVFSQEEKQPAPKKEEILLQVDEIEFDNVGVTATIKGAEKSVPIKVTMQRRGPWGVEKGITPVELSYNIIGAIAVDSCGSLKDAGIEVGTVAVQMVTEAGEEALKSADEALQQVGASAKDALKDAGFSRAGESAEKAIQDAGNALKDGLKGLGL